MFKGYGYTSFRPPNRNVISNILLNPKTESQMATLLSHFNGSQTTDSPPPLAKGCV